MNLDSLRAWALTFGLGLALPCAAASVSQAQTAPAPATAASTPDEAQPDATEPGAVPEPADVPEPEGVEPGDLEPPERDSPATVAGRTLGQWSEELSSKSELVRLRALRTLPHFGSEALDALTAALDDPSPAARYWAAYGLGDLCRNKQHEAAHKRLRAMLKSGSAGERISAAYALCRMDHVDEGLPVLIEALEQEERGLVCSTCDFLARIGPRAIEAVPALEKVSERSDNHVRDASREALRRIQRKPRS